jgi:hypothetical protein
VIDAGVAVEDARHQLSPEERFQIAMALQK